MRRRHTSMEHPFLDNAVDFYNYTDKERQFLHNIDVKRGVTGAAGAAYMHKDGTNVIMIEHHGFDRPGGGGLDVILVKNNDYLHFETVARIGELGNLNITIGNFDSEKQQKLSYPMDDVMSSLKIGKVLSEKVPNVAKVFNEYMPEEKNDMVEAILFGPGREKVIKATEEKAKQATFMAAFNKWNER